MTTEYLGECAVDGCPRPAERRTPWGNLCPTHRKRISRTGGGTTLSKPVQERQPPKEKFRELALALADADSDESYARAEGDLDAAAEARAKAKATLSKLEKAAEAYGSELVKARHGERIKQGIAATLAAGGRGPGRPPRLDQNGAIHLVKQHGESVSAAAAASGLSQSVIRRALRRKPKTQVFTEHGDMHALSGPPSGGDSTE